MEEGKMDVSMIDIEEDLAALFGDDDFKYDASDGFDEEEVYEVSDIEVATGVTIRELGPRVYATEGQIQIDVQQRDTQIQQLQTTVTEMGSKESILMWCILGLERRIAALERRPPGPQ
ncbi:hypothetical protein Tco_0065101 [Tanacetum coccineum]